ncbi:porin family protein [Rufibacter sp. LB8]|uniref:type IX secretion/gliding motility protein PorT/SprT n=1 Tax=Rufibacter sp. LB8 TaxID=2777781 RepID=UPI00178C4985|nr:porin family protein [Rufibacter sp. LB8]
MALTHVWHQLHLHRFKIIAFLCVALAQAPQQAQAQKILGENLPGYEYRKIRWGFSLGMNASWYQLQHSQTYVDQLGAGGYSVNDKVAPGFNVNFIATYRLSQDFQIRLQPGVGYYGRTVEYKGMVDGTGEDKTVLQELNTFNIEVPLLVKYESLRRKNSQMYFIAGVKPSVVVGGQKKGNPEVLQVGTADFTIEYGVGLDMFYPFFKFSPELRYARGITNVHKPYDSVYNNSIKSLTTNTITLYLNFE